MIEKIQEIIEEDEITPENIALYLEGLIQDNTKLMEEQQELQGKIGDFAANQELENELVSE